MQVLDLKESIQQSSILIQNFIRIAVLIIIIIRVIQAVKKIYIRVRVIHQKEENCNNYKIFIKLKLIQFKCAECIQSVADQQIIILIML